MLLLLLVLVFVLLLWFTLLLLLVGVTPGLLLLYERVASPQATDTRRRLRSVGASCPRGSLESSARWTTASTPSIGPPSIASGVTCPMMNPCEPKIKSTVSEKM